MKSSESVAKLAAALNKAQAEFRSVGKSGENRYDNYRYADLEDYVGVVQPVLSRQGLSVISSVEDVVALDDRTTKNGGCEHVVRVKLLMRILHESGEWLEGYSWGEGQDRADKAIYKAITGARKYGLASAFGLATSDDPERDEQVGQDGAPKQQKPPKQPKNAPKASDAQVREIKDLLSIVRLPEGTVEKWMAKAGVSTWEQMPGDVIAKCIEYTKNRLPAAGAAA